MTRKIGFKFKDEGGNCERGDSVKLIFKANFSARGGSVYDR